MKRLVLFTFAVLTVAVLTAPARADKPVARVAGVGAAVATDPDNISYEGNVFAIAGRVYADGDAVGGVEFLFGPDFSATWGAVPGVDFIHLQGEITAGSVAADGTVTLMGFLTETDYSWTDGVVFVEENVPFVIVVTPGSKEYSFQWCELPTYGMEVTNGNVVVK